MKLQTCMITTAHWFDHVLNGNPVWLRQQKDKCSNKRWFQEFKLLIETHQFEATPSAPAFIQKTNPRLPTTSSNLITRFFENMAKIIIVVEQYSMFNITDMQ